MDFRPLNLPKGSKRVLDVHCHGKYEPEYDERPQGGVDRNTNFSDYGSVLGGDIPLAEEPPYVPNMMVDPLGGLHLYDPKDPEKKNYGRAGESLGSCPCDEK